jgi:hypothetical protein
MFVSYQKSWAKPGTSASLQYKPGFKLFSDTHTVQRKSPKLKRKNSNRIDSQDPKKGRINSDDFELNSDNDLASNNSGIVDAEKEKKDKERQLQNDDDNSTDESEMETDGKTKEAEKINVKLLENPKNVASGLKTSLHGTIFQVFY